MKLNVKSVNALILYFRCGGFLNFINTVMTYNLSYETLTKALVKHSVMWRERQTVRWERTVAPRRAGTKGKGSIRPLCSGGGAIAHNKFISETDFNIAD